MRLDLIRFKQVVFLFAAASVTFTACGPGPEDDPNNNEDDSLQSVVNNGDKVIGLEGEIFSIPSPMQTAILIKESGANYDKGILNSPKSASSYSTNFQKALNLGIYGADLGYVTMYDQTQDALAYMQSVKKLGDDLGVSAAFDMTLMQRFEKNLGNKDSMMVLVSDAYRASDSYLKNSDRNDVSALVLTGGWIESLYFATNVNKTKSTPEVARRIGEQKSSLESLIRLLGQHRSQPEYEELVASLEDLLSAFEGVTFEYVYQDPITDASKKMTTITSKTEVKITPDQIKVITEKIESIRKQLVGQSA